MGGPQEAVAGSTTAFAALHAQMLRKQVVGIAVMNPRSNAQPRLVALLPQVRLVSCVGVCVGVLVGGCGCAR